MPVGDRRKRGPARYVSAGVELADALPVTVSRRPASTADKEAALSALHARQYRPMLRLALVDAQATADEVVQDVFVNLRRRWRHLGDPAAAEVTCVGPS